MRVRRVRIGSLGGVRDREYTFSEGMTVLYGPNESGKTTTMEFMRSTLSPNPSKRKLYPERRKTDSGTLEYEEDGEVRTLELSSRDVIGPAPSCLEGMDPELYRNVFALDPGSLDDDAAVTKGGIKSRFLTVPGGEGMADSIESVSADCKRILGSRKGRSELQDLEAEISSLTARVDAGKAAASAYGDKAGELEEARRRAAELRESSRSEREARDTARLYSSNRENYDRLASLRAERASLGGFTEVTPEDVAERGRLDTAMAAADAVVRGYEERRDALNEEMGGVDPRKVSRSGTVIDGLPSRLEGYRRDSEELSRLEEVPPAPPKRVPKLLYAGVALAAVGAVLSAFVSVYCLVITLVGAAAAVASLVGSRGPAPPARDEERIRRLREGMSAFRSDLGALSSELGIPMGDPADTVSRLTGLRATATAISRMQVEDMRVRKERSDASAELSLFLSRFGGPEGFDECLRRTTRASELDRRISELEGAIRSAGLDPDAPECPVEWTDTGTEEGIREADRRAGELEAELRAILDMRGLEADMDRLESLRAERVRLLRDGAEAVIAEALAEAACAASYRGVQPSVVTRASGYLGAMTGGSCTLAVDPRTDEMSVVTADGSRGMQGWSTGLRAQVLLSVKLSIAYEMGGGEVPVILDDVLLPFDSARKEGAVRALAELSRDMQVILFTCDAETRHIALSTEGVLCQRMRAMRILRTEFINMIQNTPIGDCTEHSCSHSLSSLVRGTNAWSGDGQRGSDPAKVRRFEVWYLPCQDRSVGGIGYGAGAPCVL